MSQNEVHTPSARRALDVAIAEALGEAGQARCYSTEIFWANVLVQKMEVRGYTFHTPAGASGQSFLGFSKAPGLPADQFLEVEVVEGDRALAVAQAAYRALRHFAAPGQ
jgi:hypothetical protein